VCVEGIERNERGRRVRGGVLMFCCIELWCGVDFLACREYCVVFVVLLFCCFLLLLLQMSFLLTCLFFCFVF